MTSRVILVTGGTGALGSEIVRALTQSTPATGAPSFEVVANFHRDERRAKLLQNETGCALHRANIGDEAEFHAMFQALPSLFALIHVAGIARDELLLRQSREDWNCSLSANLDSAFFVARAALQNLEDGGRLIFFASRVGENGNAGQTAYAASKAGVLALMKTAAREGAARRLAVNAICPGFVPSAMNQTLSTPALKRARRASLFGEFGGAREVAGLVRWLLSSEAGAVSGQVLHCDNRFATSGF